MLPKFFLVYEESMQIVLIFEYLQGGSLLERIMKKKIYNELEAAILIRNLLELLEYLEKSNIIHRDIKPENIMLKYLDNNCDVKLIDFGLVFSEDNQNQIACGTPGYLAPEILNGSQYNSKIDIYSVGIVLYCL